MGISGWRARTRATTARASANPVPASRARMWARWIVGPSATGSEKGAPSSRASAPPSMSASTTSSLSSGVGSPSMTKGTKAPSPAARSRENIRK